MKKLNLLMYLVLLLSAEGLLCQDLLDPPKLNVVDTSSAINRNRDFFLGWNWGSPGQKLDSALLMNSYHDFPESSTDTKFDMKNMEVPGDWGSNIIGGRNSNNVFLGLSLQLEPTIQVDSTYNFRPRFYD